VIDLHLHTTASDGRLSPDALVNRAAAAGLTVLGVTDHDTTAGLPLAAETAGALGVRLVPGIEITAVECGRDVHILGYFFDPGSRALTDFLSEQRVDRLRRVAAIGERLRELGYGVDTTALLDQARHQPGRTIGRPQIADALVAAGYATDRRDAFDRLLGEGRPAFVARAGAAVARVTAVIHDAGGIASLAHPVLLGIDHEIPRLARQGLDALEVRHSDHDQAAEARYRGLAASLGLAVSGGSDFHGDASVHAARLGEVTLSEADFAILEARRMRA
jgi:predicted metal-dependent phosphoesterase TrpH